MEEDRGKGKRKLSDSCFQIAFACVISASLTSDALHGWMCQKTSREQTGQTLQWPNTDWSLSCASDKIAIVEKKALTSSEFRFVPCITFLPGFKVAALTLRSRFTDHCESFKPAQEPDSPTLAGTVTEAQLWLRSNAPPMLADISRLT